MALDRVLAAEAGMLAQLDTSQLVIIASIRGQREIPQWVFSGVMLSKPAWPAFGVPGAPIHF
jgi:hypothetical protein